MYETLQIIKYPDARLKQVSVPVDRFDDDLGKLVSRMFDLMRLDKGVGLAAPQVGINRRLFIMNHTGEPADDRVYVNPELHEAEGNEEAEEGCLSLPGINAMIDRPKSIRMKARDLKGDPIDQAESGYIARIWQHEFDHLNGIMIIDRMGEVSKIAFRRKLRELEAEFVEKRPKKP